MSFFSKGKQSFIKSPANKADTRLISKKIILNKSYLSRFIKESLRMEVHLVFTTPNTGISLLLVEKVKDIL